MSDREAGEKKLAKVLLISKSAKEFSMLSQRLGEQGCQCTFVSSYSEAAKLFNDRPFDLVLSSGQPGIRDFIPCVTSSSASLFCAHAIEDSCLWVPVVLHGDECLGAPALRPNEFSDTVKRLLETISVPPDREIGSLH